MKSDQYIEGVLDGMNFAAELMEQILKSLRDATKSVKNGEVKLTKSTDDEDPK